MSHSGLLASAAFALAVAASCVGQSPVPQVDDVVLEQRITAACATLRAAGTLRRSSDLFAEAQKAGSVELAAAAARSGKLDAPDLHDLVRRSVCIVGHYYECTECDEWHLSAATGFCVSADGAVATCAHVLEADASMPQAFLVVADLDGHVWPVERVLASDQAADVCILATPARECASLPLRAGVRVGERIHCLSNPDHQFGFFSEGIVARSFVLRASDAEPHQPPDAAPPRPWLHVTCDFAGGSSGAPIVDSCGNVVAMAQSTTTVVHDEAAEPVETQMVLKTAAPAAALLALLRPPPKADAQPVPAGR